MSPKEVFYPLNTWISVNFSNRRIPSLHYIGIDSEKGLHPEYIINISRRGGEDGQKQEGDEGKSIARC